MANLSTSFLVPVTSVHSASSPFGFSALLDSGSSNCFLSPKIIKTHKLLTSPVSPARPLSMIDRTSAISITEQISLPVSFPSGDTYTINFFIAPLDSTCEAVLGLDWLVTYNPLVDWTTCRLTFCATHESLITPSKSTSVPQALLDKDPVAARTAPLFTLHNVTENIADTTTDTSALDVTDNITNTSALNNADDALTTPLSISFINAVAFY